MSFGSTQESVLLDDDLLDLEQSSSFAAVGAASPHADFSEGADGAVEHRDRRPVLVAQVDLALAVVGVVDHHLEDDVFAHARRERQLEGADVVGRLHGLDALRDQVVGAVALVLQSPQELDDLGVLLSRDAHDVVRLRRVADDLAAGRLLLDFGGAAAQDEHQQCHGRRDHER